MFEVGRWIEKQYLVVERHRGWRWILYIVQDRISENVFVIKTPSRVLPFGASAMARFADKAKIWIDTCEHDEIVKAFLLREFEGIPHLFLEYMDGPSLADILSVRPGKPLPIDQTVALMKQLIKGMKFLHGANLPDGGCGVVHGNLTPRNILTKSGNIKITDIGLADPFRQSAETINADLLLSKISYMAPEQIEDPRRTDNLTDIYSFGAIMYEVATGTRPMRSMRPGDPLAEVIRFEPFPPSRRNRSCPRWLEETILKCMARKPENRFQSFEHIDTFVGKLLELGEMSQAPTAKEKKSARVYRIAHVRGVAKKESRGLDQYYLGVEHLMLGLLVEEESLVVSCFGDEVTAEQLRSGITLHLPKGEGPWYWDGLRKTPRYKRVMKLARRIKRESAHEHMLPQHLLLAILEEGRNVPVRVLRELKVDIKDAIGNLRREIRRRRPGIFGIHPDTPMAPYASRVSGSAGSPYFTKFVGRRSELERAQSILLDDGKSIVIIGEPGVGKTTFVHRLERLISGTAARAGLERGGMFQLRTVALIASAEERDEVIGNFVDTINGIIDSNSILLIEDLPMFLRLGGKLPPGTAAGTLEECISLKGLLMVATATSRGYALCESEHKNLVARLEVVNLPEPSNEDALEMLTSAREKFELEHSARIPDEALTAALNLSDGFLKDRALPARAFELLERACINARLSSYASKQAKAPITITVEEVRHALTEGS